jgi:hypothetical protein
MDQLYHLPFRDWMELSGKSTTDVADADPESGSGDGNGRR